MTNKMGLKLLAIIGFAVIATNVEGTAQGKNMVCYFTNWAKIKPSGVDPNLCTHIVYAFVGIGYDSKMIMKPEDGGKMVTSLMKLKQANPNLLITVAVGGDRAGSTAFTRICSSEANMKTFANNAVEFSRRWGFDGFDMDWEYPGDVARGSPPRDKQNYSRLMQMLREKFEQEARATRRRRLLLTAAVSAGRWRMRTAYEIPKVCSAVDLIHLMTYDLHGSWERTTDHHSRLRGGPLNVADSVNAWIEGGCPRNKLVLGIPLYGRGFTLSNPANSGYGAPKSGPSKAGQYTQKAGMLAYYEICVMPGYPVVDMLAAAPYKVNGDQWIGYENVESVRRKVEFIQRDHLAGAMVWSLDLDDFMGVCPSHKKMALSWAIRDALQGSSAPYVPTARPTTQDPWRTAPPPIPTTQSGAFTCNGKANGSYPDPVNSGIYHVCAWGDDYVMDCPPGLVYRGGGCVWP